ncbi:MAG: type II secretion system protein GspG, partial [Verrucomicrobiota bacterium]|nr:type II secretion system protein GspG [Verrucomicrobiota bacterium]
MKTLWVIIALAAGVCSAAETNTARRAFVWGGYPLATNWVEDTRILTDPLPPEAFSEKVSRTRLFFYRVTDQFWPGVNHDWYQAHYEKALAQQRFWSDRFAQRLYAVEKNFYTENSAGFLHETEAMKQDYALLAGDPVGRLLFFGYSGISYSSFLRMLESPLPQHAWVTSALITGLFPPFAKLEITSTGDLKGMEQTAHELLRLACCVVAHRDKHGQLPQSLEQAAGEVPKDAWGNEYLYETQEGKWLVKSLGENGVDDGYSFGDAVSIIRRYQGDMIVYEGMSANGMKLFLEGELKTKHGGHFKLPPNGFLSIIGSVRA